MCYHIVRWYESMRAAPAIRRCYRTMSTAQTIRRRGITGDRSDGYLDPGADLAIAKMQGRGTVRVQSLARRPQRRQPDGERIQACACLRPVRQEASGCRGNYRPQIGAAGNTL